MIQQRIQYAGDTPLASTLSIEETGAMQLTVRAGSFTTTGEARIVNASSVEDPDALVAAGKAEWLPDNKRLRIWLIDQNGNFIEKSASHILSNDVIFNISSDSTDDKLYSIEFGLYNNLPDVLCRSQLAGEGITQAPVGWETVQQLSEFIIPANTTNLANIIINVYTVLPGFSETGYNIMWGYTADGQLWQRG